MSPAQPDPTTLFDPTSTVAPKCPACLMTSKNLCGYDADIAHGQPKTWMKRPRFCLNRYDPATAQLPEGF